MTLLEVAQLASVILSPVFAAGAAYAAVNTRLNELDRRYTELRGDIGRAHSRIDGLMEGARGG